MKADCTVKALAAVAAIEYELANSIAQDAGRIAGRRFSSAALIDEAKTHGITFRKLRFTGKTLNKFIQANPVGRFYVRKKGHAFAVCDGVVSDATPLGVIVQDAWKFSGVAA